MGINFQTATWNEMRDVAHQNAVDKGWWSEGDREVDTVLELMCSEVAEATEADRSHWPAVCFEIRPDNEWDLKNEVIRADGKRTGMVDYELMRPLTQEFNLSHRKPEGAATELVDLVIRCFDYAGRHKFDIDTVLEGMDEFLDVDTVKTYSPSRVRMDFYRIAGQAKCHDDMEHIICALILMAKAYFHIRGWNLREVIELKHNYNTTRPVKHGGKAF